jgi:hypothetical protein
MQIRMNAGHNIQREQQGHGTDPDPSPPEPGLEEES